MKKKPQEDRGQLSGLEEQYPWASGRSSFVPGSQHLCPPYTSCKELECNNHRQYIIVPKIGNRRNHQGADPDSSTGGFNKLELGSKYTRHSGAGTWMPRGSNKRLIPGRRGKMVEE
ncbi:uncharacterized protein LOC144289799 [Canis aureus]